MNVLRRIASLPVLRSFLLQPTVRRHLASLLALRFLLVARRVDDPMRLVRNEFRRPRVATYTITETGVPVTLLHRRDLEALFELFERGEYEPPAELRERLGAGRVRSVLDIGGNVGMFAAWAAGRWPGARVTSFEPSPESTVVFREWQARGGLDVELVEACAMTVDGPVHFVEGLGGGSHEGTAENATTVLPGIDVFPYLGKADFAKIDIEGGEWAILSDPRLADLHSLTLAMEYHRNRAPSLPAEQAARDLLTAAGFQVGHVTPNHWGHGTLWAWKD